MARSGVAVAGFSTRHEGVSRPPYNTLNLGSNTLDLPHAVEGNRSILARSLGSTPEMLVSVNQVHGVDLLVINSPNPDYSHFHKLECDGIVCSVPGVLVGVTVADCAPVLLLDPVKKVAAALHAGWKGTAANICRKGVEAMVTVFSCDPHDILAGVGPAIGPCCYQVDQPVLAALAKSGYDRFATPDGDGKWRLDLAEANVAQLLDAGLKEGNIERSGVCVSCTPDLYFSYRRDDGDTGRQMGFIMLKPERKGKKPRR
ncbi:MAG TPA: peptidoglycan editing factor PgeF [Verrucomicrobiae bacterium]|nr:peptidoglycan editing factor PgeF [Verrucomicrobiae bacterium]